MAGRHFLALFRLPGRSPTAAVVYWRLHRRPEISGQAPPRWASRAHDHEGDRLIPADAAQLAMPMGGAALTARLVGCERLNVGTGGDAIAERGNS
jgi:hypothetical protein